MAKKKIFKPEDDNKSGPIYEIDDSESSNPIPVLENSEAVISKNNKAPRPDKKYREEGDLLIPIENE